MIPNFLWPTPPSGPTNEASFMRRLVDCCKRSVPKAGPGLIAKQDKDGITFSLANANAVGAVGAGFQFAIITALHNADYFTARPWNPSALDGEGNFAGSEILIAKCLDARMLLSKQYGATIVIYDYTSDPPHADNVRQATVNGGSPQEYQVINPLYTPDDGTGDVGDIVMYAQTKIPTGIKGPAGQAITFIELQPNRRWVYQANQSGMLT